MTHDPDSKRGTTEDPEQANLTDLPDPVKTQKPKVVDKDDPQGEPGTTSDPNQADRT